VFQINILFKCSFHWWGNIFICGSGPQINLIPGAVLNLFDWYAVCRIPILVMSGLPPGDYNLTIGCQGNSMTANFSPQVCSPKGESGKKQKPVLCGVLWTATIENKGWQRITFWFIQYSEGKFFSKIVGFKGAIRIFFNMVAFPICLFETLFSCQNPFKGLKRHWYEISVSTKHIGRCHRPSICTATIFKNCLIWKSFYLWPRTAD
jgi:hypothetical protein